MLSDVNNQNMKQYNFLIALIFIRTDFHSAEDQIKELFNNFSKKLPIIPILQNDKYHVIDSLYNLGITGICFDFKPDTIMEEIKLLTNEDDNKEEKTKRKEEKHYIINFYENKGTLIIDLSGPLKKQKLTPLKLMFENFLRGKLQNLKGIVYIFSDIDEDTINFETIWTLLKIWKILNVEYKKITYLSKSEIVVHTIDKYFNRFGMKHFENLLDITKYLYPEMLKKNEVELFEFSSQLLEAPKIGHRQQ